ncbi:efflux transporter outer membrane subunit [Pseudomonas fluorescens]|uniref:efflux transporter outer membrane subunit n=1 Tax=Pseudomonas fluorescens TaxID=294 RepID=UPI00112FFB4A|nr:efflux transporter outer membrane subunit [Pseudomonas fluorescens]TMU70800.1 efflux transporter outer membrane subunit [Pseudomonas fluorescens]
MNPGLSLCVTVCCLALVGCSFEPDYVRPALPVAPSWRAGSSADHESPTDLQWQSVFQGAYLQTLISTALDNNRDLRIAVNRMDEARAQFQIQRADVYPNLSLAAQAQRQRVSKADAPYGGSGVAEHGQLGLSLNAYELDLWGRLRNLKGAANELYTASVEEALSVKSTLIAQVAQAYFEALASVELQRQSDESLAIARRSHALVSQRRLLGVSSQLEVQQAQSLVLSAEAEQASVLRQRNVAFNQLEFLVGTRVDQSRLQAGSLDDAGVIASIAPGLPSALLVRRPDIRAQEARLKASNANIGAARAAFLPKISLTGLLGFSSPQLSALTLGNARSWSFTPDLQLPIFDAGRNVAQLDLAWAQHKTAISEYEKTIQSAFHEVADALDSSKAIAAELDAERQWAANESQRTELAELLYRDGVNSYLDVLDAQRQWRTAQQNLIKTRLLQLTNRIALYKGLGGGWTEAGSIQ